MHIHLWKRLCVENQGTRIKYLYECVICHEREETATFKKKLGKFRLKLHPLRTTYLYIGKKKIKLWGE